MDGIFAGSIGEYVAAPNKTSEMATLRLEERSLSHPGRMNVLVQAGTFDACQSIVMQVMDDVGTATFTIPVCAADGQFIAIGHYQESGAEKLPEL